jgi:hypothetical protein
MPDALKQETAMSWSLEKIVKHVKQNAPASSRKTLLRASTRRYKDAFDNIYQTYYSLPDWIALFKLEKKLEGKIPFDHVIAEYNLSTKRYHEQLSGVLDMLFSRTSGRALLTEVSRPKRNVWIMPYFHYYMAMPGQHYSNATPYTVSSSGELSSVSDGIQRNDKDAWEKGAPSRDTEGNPDNGLTGTGAGAHVVLFFSVETWKGQTEAGSAADEVLFHELVHIARMLRGQMTLEPVTGDGGYGNIEEFLATVLTNIYMSEKGKTQLRGSYSYTGPVNSRAGMRDKDGAAIFWVIDPFPKNWEVLREPEKFYQNSQKTNPSPRQLMQILHDRQLQFYSDLARIPETAKFNPVREHYKENLKPDI